MLVSFVHTILQDLDSLEMGYEEHYDPSGMQLYLLSRYNDINPVLLYSEKHPDDAMISISVQLAYDELEECDYSQRVKLQRRLVELSRSIPIHSSLSLQNGKLKFVIGITLHTSSYNAYTMQRGIEILIDHYEYVIREIQLILKDF